MKRALSTVRLIRVIVTTAGVVRMAKKKKKLPGHFCKVCGLRKSNESFSGRGHAAHICKACSRLSPARQAEEMTLRRLENLPLRRLSESEMTWLKNRTHDHRPEVKTLACMVYAERFPRLARNQKKQELAIQTLKLSIDGEVCDSYGDPVYIRESYRVSRTPPVVVCTQQDGISQVIEPPPKILAKLLKWTVHTLEIFWWEEDYCGPADVESEEEPPLWSVHVEYSNGEIQDMESADDVPDPVLELLSALAELFE